MRFYDVMSKLLPELRQPGERIPVIAADNIVRQLEQVKPPAEATLDPSSYSWPASSYGVVAPPFPVTWVEAVLDPEDYGAGGMLGRVRKGALVADMSWARPQWEALGVKVTDIPSPFPLHLHSHLLAQEGPPPDMRHLLPIHCQS